MANAELARQRNTHLALAELKAACANCNLRELCFPAGLSVEDLDHIESLVQVRRHVKRGEAVYRNGDALDSLYAIRSGFFKSTAVYEDGRDQITGFSMMGEILGMDGISEGIHHCEALALEDSVVCAIPYEHLEELAHKVTGLQRNFHQLMSREIAREGAIMMLLGVMHAEERVAAFLLNLSQRYAVRGYSPTDFHLRMTREEIGSYLGLKLETVSRAFSKFQADRLLDVDQKHVKILDLAGLQSVYAHHVV